MQISSRILFLLVFSCSIFFYTLVVTFRKKFYLNQLRQVYIASERERHEILQDRRWLGWGMPKDYLEYTIAWIFENNPTARVIFKGESEIDYKIKSCFFEIESNLPLNLPKPPFGCIKKLESNGNKFLIEWQMSLELNESPSLKSLVKDMKIKVNYILLQKDGNWSVKLNEKILKKGEAVPWKNVEIIDIGENWIYLKVRTPQGCVQSKVFCGDSLYVSYF